MEASNAEKIRMEQEATARKAQEEELRRKEREAAEAAARAQRTSARVESQNPPARLLHLDQFSAHHGDGILFLPLPQSFTREVVQSVSG